MAKEFQISSFRQEKTEKGANLTVDLVIGDTPYSLVYKACGVDSLCQRVDGIVVSFLLYAMQYKLDFVSEYPITETLYYRLVHHVIPQIRLCNPNSTSEIQLKMPHTTEKLSPSFRGTGISCGVDSLATFYEYTEDMPLADYKLTHLVYLKTGMHHGNLGRFDRETEDRLYHEELAHAEAFCRDAGYPLVTVETNLHEIICSAFRYGYDTTHALRNCGTLLMLQEHFDKYYYASAYNLDAFQLKTNESMSYYDKMLLPLISNENISFYSANRAMERIEKTEYISRFPLSGKYLQICWMSSENCGVCAKCIRTLVTLDLLGVLENYRDRFDLDAYYKNRKKYLARVVALHRIDSGYHEIYCWMKRTGKKMPGFRPVFSVRFRYVSSILLKSGPIKTLRAVKKRLAK